MQESKAGNGAESLFYASVCLLTSRPITECHFHFRAVARDFEDVRRHRMA